MNRLLTAWLLQHYALAVWLTTGVNTRRRKPAAFTKLVPILNFTISGQVIFFYQSAVFWLTGRSWTISALVLGIVSVVIVLIALVLPWLERHTRRQGVPELFHKLSQSQRRGYAWFGFLLFWAAFSSIFFVAASLD